MTPPTWDLDSASEIPQEYHDCMPCFVPEVDVDDPQAVLRYAQTLLTLRAAAQASPLHRGWSFTATIPPFSPTHASTRRPYPNFALHGGSFRFILDSGLQPMDLSSDDAWQWSQVWVARVEGTEETVVLKILQSSILPLPDLEEEHSFKYSAFGRQVASTENLIYTQRLAEVQGAVVPYYLGKVKVTMPNGEEARVLILEHIKGKTLAQCSHEYEAADTAGKRASLEDLRDMLTPIEDSYKAINACGVYHLDVSPKNVIIPDSDCSAVVIDFGHSGVATKENINRQAKVSKESEGQAVIHAVLNWFKENSGEFKEEFLLWTKEENVASHLQWNTDELK
ncbi:hypothetical protein BDZ89DRAFT_1261608 [Hymenopellis radicata]|nr:hypothetical protein BDZ89DRAFT_1261608 [Hymenopellis radicata]